MEPIPKKPWKLKTAGHLSQQLSFDSAETKLYLQGPKIAFIQQFLPKIRGRPSNALRLLRP